MRGVFEQMVQPLRTLVLASFILLLAPAILVADKGFWAFQPVRKLELPAVRDGSWPRSPIDHCVLAAFEAKGRKCQAFPR